MSTAFQNASRKRAAAAIATYGVVLAVILGFFVAPVAAIITIVLTAFVVWRNLVGGLFVTEDKVVVRNLTHTLRLPRSEVTEITVMAGAHDTTGAGYVCVITDDGSCHRATGLRRDPLRGEALVASIRAALATR